MLDAVKNRVAQGVVGGRGRRATAFRRDFEDEEDDFSRQEENESSKGPVDDCPRRVRWHKGSVLSSDRRMRSKIGVLSNKIRGLQWALVAAFCGAAVYYGIPMLIYTWVLYLLHITGWCLCGLLVALGLWLVFPRLLGIILTQALVPVVHGFPLRFEYVHLNIWVTWGKLHARVKAEGVGFGNPPHFPHFYFLKVVQSNASMP